MNTLSMLPTLFALPMLVACQMGDAEAKPTDAPLSKITKTQPFHSVEISGGFEVQLETGEGHSIEVIGAPDAISTVKIEVAGGELSVSRETSFWRNSSVQLRIVSPSSPRSLEPQGRRIGREQCALCRQTERPRGRDLRRKLD